MKCSKCLNKKRKMRAYGSKRKLIWCDSCDAQLTTPVPNKKYARQESKKIIKEAS